ncbi:SDR family oxidoreductase [Desulfovibrio aerotolerans]|uniref:SDR family oxidoreductase n=1 Tax=Solidesulfovibrio aerotolerans TaxID=295255 RepID=A0A7C9MHW3_9BACT|nr:SDR family oxidoreductase [Solidesulfovibrio aerotolerans]MYL82169.1 SDR family oxidoreductase [Solidesulfovibrio aerotolerans]
MDHKRVAIVTGASRGIGAAIAKRLAADGLAVVVNYVNGEAKAQAVVRDIVAAGGHGVAIRADVADSGDAAELFAAAEAVFGGVDVLVNNAGVMQQGLVPLADTDDALFDRLVSINLRGSFNMLRLAATKLRQGGRIVNFSSSVVGLAPPGYAVYAATKAAIETMTAIFAKELRGRDITVTAIAPGPVGTELFLIGKTPEMVEKIAQAAPMGRLGTPEDIARVTAFLVGPQGGWINGAVIRANGGLV